MYQLFVRIDRERKSALFSGRDTFRAKDAIKLLGRARYLSATKEWEVQAFAVSRSELESRFPGITVEESAGGSPAPVGESSPPLFPPVEAPLASSVEESRQRTAPAGLSVPEFLATCRNALRAAFPPTFCVYGVLREVNRSGADRMFLDLGADAEGGEYLRCAIWEGVDRICRPLEERGFKLEADLEVMFEVALNVGGKGGYLSLTIRRIVVEYTVAKLAALREQTNERLRKEGIFGRNKERALPFLPRRLGVLTSSGGTVIHDFLASLDEAQFGFEVLWFPIAVQGAEAKRSLLRGIELLGKIPDLDAILIFRGGGSQADLAVFNDYDIARAVCLAPYPVISAIGHQEDDCSVQDVSFHGRGVPKDIGRYFADIIVDFRERFRRALQFIVRLGDRQLTERELVLERVARTLSGAASQLCRGRSDRIIEMSRALPRGAEGAATNARAHFLRTIGPLSVLAIREHQGAEHRLANFGERIRNRAEQVGERGTARFAQLGSRLGFSIARHIERGTHRLAGQRRLVDEAARFIEGRESSIASYDKLLPSLGTEAQLKRGFALIRSGDEKGYITSVAALPIGAEAVLELHDGTRPITVTGEGDHPPERKGGKGKTASNDKRSEV